VGLRYVKELGDAESRRNGSVRALILVGSLKYRYAFLVFFNIAAVIRPILVGVQARRGWHSLHDEQNIRQAHLPKLALHFEVLQKLLGFSENFLCRRIHYAVQRVALLFLCRRICILVDFRLQRLNGCNDSFLLCKEVLN